MTWKSSDWHARFCQQARWTEHIRRHIFNRIKFKPPSKILDVGCGTGALLDEFNIHPVSRIYAIDIKRDFLVFAKSNNPNRGNFTQADAHFLPYRNQAFDITFCHFLLMWVTNPVQVINEMVRVTRPGGAVLALAEPDYGGRIDHPEELTRMGLWQRKALRHQEADPLMGRKLAGVFSSVALKDVETGVLGGQWSNTPTRDDFESEWATLISDLESLGIDVSSKDIKELKALDSMSWTLGKRVLYVPTFYAWGRVRDK
ncbi:MAG: methyltransferase domain-containing protein [Anaerolineales bacterium]|jgi:SAM-dependent methyltransferase